MKVRQSSQSHRLLSNLRQTTYVVLAASLILSTGCKSTLFPSRQSAHFVPNFSDANNKKTPSKTVHRAPDKSAEDLTSLPSANPTVLAPEQEPVSQSASAEFVATEIAATPVTAVLGNVALEAPNETTAAESMNRSGVAYQPATKLVITGVRPERGVVKVAIYGSEMTFLQPDVAVQTFELATTNSTIETNLRRFSRVAIAVYQDFDSNGKLNRNSAGIPTEPFAFSNNAMGKRGPPSFEQAAVKRPERDASGDEAPLVVIINLP